MEEFLCHVSLCMQRIIVPALSARALLLLAIYNPRKITLRLNYFCLLLPRIIMHACFHVPLHEYLNWVIFEFLFLNEIKISVARFSCMILTGHSG